MTSRPAAFAALASLILLLAAVTTPLRVEAANARCTPEPLEALTAPLPVAVPNKLSSDDNPFPRGIGYNPPSRYVDARGSVETTSDGCGVKVKADVLGRSHSATVGGAADVDANHDGMGDNWAKDWESRTGQLLQAGVDSDQDGLLNVNEFRWNLVPVCLSFLIENCRDHEAHPLTGVGGDGWNDGAEARYWNDEANDGLSLTGLALLDPDRLLDSDSDGDSNVNDTDSDNDGLRDGAEALVYGTFPELPDSDCSTSATSCSPSFAPMTLHGDRQGSPGSRDGLNDSAELTFWEAMQPGSWTVDHDGDGIANALLDPDSDNDGILDGAEVLLGKGQVRPDLVDTDGDGVHDNDEAAWSEDTTDADDLVNAADTDSDDDGMPDGWEVQYGFNMVVAADAAQDFDNDGLSNLGEFQHGTIPTDPDTEGDELQDGPEVAAGTNPFQWDSDGDTLPDAWEDRHKASGPNPLAADPNADPDADSFTASWCGNVGASFTNRQEYLHGIPNGHDSRPPELGGDGVYWDGTNPRLADTDGDGLADGYEVCSGLDPRRVDVLGGDDADQDGLSNAAEVPAGTRHDDADTDDDSLCDGGRGEACIGVNGPLWPGERDYGTSPLDADTDGEGWLDGAEAWHWDQAGAGTAPDSDRDGASNLHEADSDGDGLTDLQEHESSAAPDPGMADSDGDGLSDKVEVEGWSAGWAATLRHVTSDPRLADTDLDGFADAREHSHRTDPRLLDTDLDGLSDLQEATGWMVVVNGQAMNVTSSPNRADQDEDGLNDGGEFSLGTIPTKWDSDDDALSDRFEDTDQDARGEEGESSAVERDTDADGLLDGEEYTPWSDSSDPILADSDLDGVSDFDEVRTHGTLPLDADSDADGLGDGEELGLAQSGGSPDRQTNPLDWDHDDDGLPDGAEVYSYATNPRVADTDCDGTDDGADLNPYLPNVPPGEARPAAERACPSAPAGYTMADLPLESLVAPASAESDSDVGLLVFDEDGTITLLARAPESESPIVAVQALVWLDGQIRTTAAGALSSGSGRITAELQATDEAGASEPTASPWTHAVRMALPEGMVEATGATYALTFVDANLNSATYTGEASGFQLEEVHYEDELNPADGQDWSDPSNATLDASGWDYVHGNLTGSQGADPPAAATPRLGLLGNESVEAERVWIYRIAQPAKPSLVGGILDGQLVLLAADKAQVPVKAVLYTNTSVAVPEEDVDLYVKASWWAPLVKAVKKVVQATNKAWTATVQSSAAVFNAVGQAVKSTTLAIYDEMRNPRSPATFAARMAIDIVGIGDVIDIIDGVQHGDWLQIGIGVACLAMTVVPVLKGPVAAAKASIRVARAAGASDNLAKGLGQAIEGFAREGASAAPKIDRLNDVLRVASAGGKAKQATLDGVEIALDVKGANSLGTRQLVDTTLQADFLTKQAATKTKEGAKELAQSLEEVGSKVDTQQLAQIHSKFVAQGSDKAQQVVDAVSYFNKAAKDAPNAENGIASLAGKMGGRTKLAQADGHAFVATRSHQQAAIDKQIVWTDPTPGSVPEVIPIQANQVKFNFRDTVRLNGDDVDILPDTRIDLDTDKLILQEMKLTSKDGPIKLSKFNGKQLEKYKLLRQKLLTVDGFDDVKVQYVVQGKLSDAFKARAQSYGFQVIELAP